MKIKTLSLWGVVVFVFAVGPVPAQPAGTGQPQTASDFKNNALLQYSLKNYKEAERLFGECIRVEPRNLDCIYKRGLVRQLYIGYGLALEDFTAALQIAPNNVTLLTARGGLYYSLKRPDEGIADLTKAVQLKPDHAEAFYRRGNIYRDKKEDGKAIADYTQAVTLDPKSEFSWANRGAIYDKRGEKERAMADFTGAITANPKRGLNYYHRGKIYFEKGQMEPAEADFKRAVELDPTLAALVKSTKTLAATDKLLANLKESKKSQTPLQAANEAGYEHMNKKEWDLAIVQFSKAIELAPTVHWGYVYRGRAFEGKGDLAKALADLEKGISLLPAGQAADFHTERAELYFKQGRTALALSEMNKIIASRPAANEYDLLLRGKIHAKMGNKAAARTDLEKALQMNQYLKEAKEELAKL